MTPTLRGLLQHSDIYRQARYLSSVLSTFHYLFGSHQQQSSPRSCLRAETAKKECFFFAAIHHSQDRSRGDHGRSFTAEPEHSWMHHPRLLLSLRIR